MAVARKAMEVELARLEEQRGHYLLAARTSPSKQLALRRLLTVERLNDHIESLQEALAAFDDRTAPLFVERSPSKRVGLGPITPPAL